ncbi:hypothetical protein D3C85_1058540 [compost metagenome]
MTFRGQGSVVRDQLSVQCLYHFVIPDLVWDLKAVVGFLVLRFKIPAYAGMTAACIKITYLLTTNS